MDHVYQDIEHYLSWLSGFGHDPSGGMTRLLYDANWIKAQSALKEEFHALGLKTYYDEVGNLFGRLEGSKYRNETILSGSHIDTVVNGGTLDGQLGIIGSYLAVKYLRERYGQPLRNLEVVSMAEEEGSRFPYAFWGSKNIIGMAQKKEVERKTDFNGTSFVEAMQQAGFTFKREEKKGREDLKAFVELHIEQGNVLEREQKAVGIVTSIVGQRRYTIKLSGESIHAGTTPMGYRKDTVYALSKICSLAIEKAKKWGDPLVLTFGKVEPKPNIVNVVPEEVTFTMDCRHTDSQVLIDFTKEIETDMLNVSKEMELKIEINLWMDELPVPMDKQTVSIMETACREANLNYRMMHSGAGHDAQIFATKIPAAMLFVPSISGISHNPKEATRTEDLVEGVKALTATLYQLAYK